MWNVQRRCMSFYLIRSTMIPQLPELSVKEASIEAQKESTNITKVLKYIAFVAVAICAVVVCTLLVKVSLLQTETFRQPPVFSQIVPIQDVKLVNQNKEPVYVGFNIEVGMQNPGNEYQKLKTEDEMVEANKDNLLNQLLKKLGPADASSTAEDATLTTMPVKTPIGKPKPELTTSLNKIELIDKKNAVKPPDKVNESEPENIVTFFFSSFLYEDEQNSDNISQQGEELTLPVFSPTEQDVAKSDNNSNEDQHESIKAVFQTEDETFSLSPSNSEEKLFQLFHSIYDFLTFPESNSKEETTNDFPEFQINDILNSKEDIPDGFSNNNFNEGENSWFEDFYLPDPSAFFDYLF